MNSRQLLNTTLLFFTILALTLASAAVVINVTLDELKEWCRTHGEPVPLCQASCMACCEAYAEAHNITLDCDSMCPPGGHGEAWTRSWRSIAREALRLTLLTVAIALAIGTTIHLVNKRRGVGSGEA